MMRLKRLATAIILVASPLVAQADLIGVQTIRVFNDVGVWLQVSEVVATESGTGNDLALASAGATASANGGNWSDTHFSSDSPDRAIDGLGPANFPGMYHSGSQSVNNYLMVALQNISSLSSLTIFGRTDCCSERDVYRIEILDANDNTLFTAGNLRATGAQGHSVTVDFTSVPEPGTLALLGIGLFGIGVAKRARKT